MNLSTNQAQQTYDVLIVGSGASGGWAAKRLSEAGLKVAILEAGRPQSAANFSEHTPKFQLKYRNMAPEIYSKSRPIQSKVYAFSEYTADWYCDDSQEPYTTAQGKPYNWLGRTRVVGGRMNIWGRICLRYNDWDMKAPLRDGYGEPWPLEYKDLAPYYDLVERYIGVNGMAEGLEERPDGVYQPPFPLTCLETHFRNRVKQKFGRTTTLQPTAVLTQSLNGRGACHYCGPCERGCMTRSYFNPVFTTVADAVLSGNCTLITNAMAYQVLMDPDRNRARGVSYIDRNTKETREINGRVVILCAQTQESVRILLNSATPQHPGGLANASGVLGHYFTNHIANSGASGEFQEFGSKPSLGGPVRPAGVYIVPFRNIKGQAPRKDFLRTYGYEGYASVDFNWSAPGYGEAYKKALHTPQVTFSIGGWGETLPRFDNFVEIDSTVKDAYGIPVIKIHMSDGENEDAISKDEVESAAEMLDAAGAKNIRLHPKPAIPYRPNHEAGMARMGSDPKKSILNQYQQAHEIRNLFVMDASGFPTNPSPNPALTIMAVCVRSCDYLMEELKRGEI